MTALLLALLAAYGVFLVYTALAFRWRGLGFGPRTEHGGRRRRRVAEWMVQAGLDEVRPLEFAAITGVLVLVGAGLAFALFGGFIAPLAAGLFAGTFPPASARSRRDRRRSEAREAWPRMIEELRVLTASAGRSIPQALFEVGLHGPAELRPAFEAAHREWLITTDFARTVTVLKARLADATADVTCETLLVAHQVGGSDIDRRLAALAEDRMQDLLGRKDAESRQAGVRFARRFVLIVPIGMAICGVSIGNGRAAYQTTLGQVGVAVAIGLLIACWVWSGRIMRLPENDRVFR